MFRYWKIKKNLNFILKLDKICKNVIKNNKKLDASVQYSTNSRMLRSPNNFRVELGTQGARELLLTFRFEIVTCF